MNTLARHQLPPSLLAECAWFVRRSRSLASMLPALLASGLVTLVYTWIAHPLRGTDAEGFTRVFMENWLVAWPIAFPIAYLLGSALLKASAWLSVRTKRRAAHVPGLAIGDVTAVSARVTTNHGRTVLRLKPARDFRA